MDDWPDCAVPDCPRKCCLALNSEFCFPHTKGNEHVKRWKIDARNVGLDDAPEVTPLAGGGYLVRGGSFRWSEIPDPEKW